MVCANEDQWPILEPVVRQVPGETVVGALRTLIENVRRVLVSRDVTLTNENLERATALHTLIDGIDYTLIDLAAVEIGEEQLVAMAGAVADQTFAARQIDAATKAVLRNVFELRARKVVEIRTAGRLGWIRETGAKTRMIDLVETQLLPMRSVWDDVTDPIEPAFVTMMLNWAWAQGDVLAAVREAYRVEQGQEDSIKESFYNCVSRWLEGRAFADIATSANLDVSNALGVQVTVITFSFKAQLNKR